VAAPKTPREPASADDDDEISHRRLRESSLDARARALFYALLEWLPRSVAWDRAMNAAASIIILETAKNAVVPLAMLEPRTAIEASLGNTLAMKGYVATSARIEAALLAWQRAESDEHRRNER
jgi:hypothetical protein